MFKQEANSLCNNTLFKSGTITRMHEQTKRLYEAAKALRATQEPSAVARLLGISPQTLKNWESRGISNSGILDTAGALGCSALWLRSGEGEMAADSQPADASNDPKHWPTKFTRVIEHDPNSEDYIEIRKVKLKLSAGITGFRAEADDNNGRPITFRKDWFSKNGYYPEKLIAIGVKGDSMEPTMSEGDTVVINTGDTALRDGKTYAINYDGEDIVKRLVKDFGRWFLVSDNPDQKRYHRQECTGATCIIIGRVVLLQRENV
ncbi:XRE family transcriptional regulator [Herbaspirillum autotrophicum]|uniref:XRE family transcriptional regulator n=1 Tax=Herbaspirillum autotrophicum TaxID=180195 RepID=UPI001E4BFAFF|nr:helix-turn-helix transcriptional regulator [Herbaspirillum autotrophicum]